MLKTVSKGRVTIILKNKNIIESEYECSFEHAINFTKEVAELFESYGVEVSSIAVDAPRTVEEIPAR